MELLKVILDFIARVAIPLAVCFSIILFKPEIGLVLQSLLRILKNVEERRQDLALGGVKVTTLYAEAALQVKTQPLESAAKTIQELLSPAAPLAVGYAENFLARLKKDQSGIQFRLDNNSPLTTSVYTIYIPHQLTDGEASSPDLIRAKYPGREIQKIFIESIIPGGRTMTGSAIRYNDRLFPVDVPQTLTSIRLVFRVRGEQLMVKGGMSAEQITKLEAESLDEFAQLLTQKIKDLEMSKCVRVIRESSDLFPEDAKAS